MTDRELLELAAKAAGIKAAYDYPHIQPGGMWIVNSSGWKNIWNPFNDDGDAFRLAVKLRINILFNGGFHHVGMDHFAMDICCLGGLDAIRWEIVNAAAEIGKAMS